MSLRKSPTRTPALLAANRANAKKSTGPCTAEGKSRAALNSLRCALRAPKSFAALAKSRCAREEFMALYLALYEALLPDKTDETATDLFQRTVLRVWAMKQGLVRWAASPAKREAWFARTGGVCPAPLQLLIKRPGWSVRVSVWVRWGRGLGRRRWFQAADNWKERRARLHVVVTVTASMRHPLLGFASLAEVPAGVAPRVVLKTKPEIIRKQKGNRYVIPIKDSATLDRGRRRAANECRPASDRPVQTLVELLALFGGRKPASPSAATAPDNLACLLGSESDLVSWLGPENAVLSGPRLSEFDDLESWIEACVISWDKQHGPIPQRQPQKSHEAPRWL